MDELGWISILNLREAVDWDVIAEADPDFSPVLFRDFVYTLFSKIHEARGDKGLARFGQFIVEDALKDLRELNPHATDVQGVIVGALQIHRVDVVGENTRVTLAKNGFDLSAPALRM